MQFHISKVHIGRRTIKTVLAVVIAMLVVDSFGATTSKLLFAMMGAMEAVRPTFKESLGAGVTQIVGVIVGAVAGILLRLLPLPAVLAAGIGILIVIVLYNFLRIPFSPSLPCFIVVMVCTTPDISPIGYAVGRIWDSAIGLFIGILINTLIFPYDNSKKIRAAMQSLDEELIVFLEDIFDGDTHLPNTETMEIKLDDIARQLNIFANQRLLFRQQYQEEQLKLFRQCNGKARELVSHLEVLCSMEKPGQLNDENLMLLRKGGANIVEQPELNGWSENDIVTNYHVEKILKLRKELLAVAAQEKS